MSLVTASFTMCFKLLMVLYKLTVVDMLRESPSGNAHGILVEKETCACRKEPGWYSSSHSITLNQNDNNVCTNCPVYHSLTKSENSHLPDVCWTTDQDCGASPAKELLCEHLIRQDCQLPWAVLRRVLLRVLSFLLHV